MKKFQKRARIFIIAAINFPVIHTLTCTCLWGICGYEKTSSPKRIKLITGGGHNNSASPGGEEYLRSIREFVEYVREKS